MSQRYNIMFVWPPPVIPTTGGVERVTDLVAKELKKRGHNIFYLNDIRAEYATYESPARIVRIPFWSQEAYPAFREAVYQHSIDFVVDQSGPSPYTWVTAPGVRNACGWPKIINVAHNDPAPPNREPHLVWLRQRGLIRSAANYDALCFISPKYREKAMEFLKLIPNSRARFETLVNPCTPLEGSGDKYEKKKEILYVGRLASDKTVGRVLDVWEAMCAEFPDWSLTIVGSGPEYSELALRASKIGRVRLTGYREDPSTFYKSASFIMLTSPEEGLPMSLLEGMSFGCVPIAYHTFDSLLDLCPGPLRRMVITPFKVGEAVAALREVINGEGALFDEMSRTAIQTAKQYALGSVVDTWEALMDSMADA